MKRARTLMQHSRVQRFAISAFNVDNADTSPAIVRAAQTKAVPVRVEISHSEAAVIGLTNLYSLVDNHLAEHAVKMYINLDHSPRLLSTSPGPLWTKPARSLERLGVTDAERPDRL